MTFTNYIFKNNPRPDSTDTDKYVSSDANSYATQGVGYGSSSVTAGAFAYNDTVSGGVDYRLGGAFFTTAPYRIDLANARYNIKGALSPKNGTQAVGIRIYDGPIADGNVILDVNSAGTVTGSQFVDIGAAANDPNAALKSASQWSSAQGIKTMSAPLTSGYVTIVKSTNAMHVNCLRVEPISDPLADAFTDSDDTGFTLKTTGSITNGTIVLPSSVSLFGGMYVQSTNVPAGRTIKAFEITGLVDGGTGFAVGDVITMPSGDKLTVMEVDANGKITQRRVRIKECGLISAGGISHTTVVSTVPVFNSALASVVNKSGGASSGTGAIFNIFPPDRCVRLNDTTGVADGTGISFKFGYIQKALFDKQPAEYPMMPIRVPIGDGTNLAITQTNGSACPYLKIAPYLGVFFIKYTGVPFPAGLTTYSFNVVQTDASGVFPGSPHSTTFTFPVTYAPSKPVGSPLTLSWPDYLLSLLDTPAFLERDRRMTLFKTYGYPEWKGQAIYPGASIKVSSLQGIISALSTHQTNENGLNGGNGGRWYEILLCDDNDPDTFGSNWVSDGGTGLAFNFLGKVGFENMNGGVVIRPAATFNSVIKGKFAISNMRGVNWHQIPPWWYATAVPPTNNGQAFGAQFSIGNDVSKPLTMVNFTFGRYGRYQDPAENPANVLIDIFGGAQIKSDPITRPIFTPFFLSNNCSDQIRFIGNDFFGFHRAININHVRMFESGGNSFRMLTDDVHAHAEIDPYYLTNPKGSNVSPFIGRVDNDDFDTYLWLHDNTVYRSYDGGTLVAPYSRVSLDDPAGAIFDQHCDFIQINPAPPGSAATFWSTMHKQMENNVISNDATNVSSIALKSVYKDVEFMIHTTDFIQNDLVFNNVIASNSPRGLDAGHGRYHWAFNTMMPGVKTPPSPAPGTQFRCTAAINQYGNTPRRTLARSRCNIATQISAGNTKGLFSIDDVVVSYADGGILADPLNPLNPANYLAGPFVTDPIDIGNTPSNRISFTTGASAAVDAAHEHRRRLWPAAIPKGKAGARFMPYRIPLGKSMAMSVAQAGSARAVTSSQPSGASAAILQARWNRNASNTGPVDGVDVTLNVS